MKEHSSPLLRSDARPVYAVSLPLDSKLPHLPRSASSSDYFIGFSPLPIYTGNEDFLRCLWRCSGFLKDSTITSKYVVALTRQKKEISVTKKKEREKDSDRFAYQFHLIQRFPAVCCFRYITNCFTDPHERPLVQRTEKILGFSIP